MLDVAVVQYLQLVVARCGILLSALIVGQPCIQSPMTVQSDLLVLSLDNV